MNSVLPSDGRLHSSGCPPSIVSDGGECTQQQKLVMAHSSSAAAAEEAPACSSLSMFDLASSHYPPDAAFCLILRGGTSRELGRGRKRSLKQESPPRSKKRPAGARRWWESTRYGDWRIRPPWWVLRPPRLVSPLLRTAATAVPTLSRETEVGKSWL